MLSTTMPPSWNKQKWQIPLNLPTLRLDPTSDHSIRPSLLCSSVPLHICTSKPKTRCPDNLSLLTSRQTQAEQDPQVFL